MAAALDAVVTFLANVGSEGGDEYEHRIETESRVLNGEVGQSFCDRSSEVYQDPRLGLLKVRS